MAKERLAYFDNLKGILIILVVIGHLIEPIATSDNLLSRRIVDFIYLFHMPLFIFVSGMFCKGVFRDGRYRVDVPLYYLALCMLLYTVLQSEKVLLGTFSRFSPLTLSGSIPWYLMALTAYVMAVPVFSRLKPAWALAGSIVLAVMTGMHNPGDFLTSARICVYLPFFLAGYYLQSASVEGFLFRLQEKRLLTVARVGAAAVLAGIFGLLCTVGPDGLVFLKKLFTARNSYATILDASGMSFSLWVMAAIRFAYYFAVAAASACVMLLVPRRKLGPVTRAGERSLQVYFMHPMVYYALNAFSFGAWLDAVLPEIGCLVVLIGGGCALALILAAPAWPQRIFDKVRHLAGKLAVAS